MYSPVSTSDCEFVDITTDMDDRESLYFDTISVAGSEPNRKSLSVSRQTIYHSAVDLPVETEFSIPSKYNNENLAKVNSKVLSDYKKAENTSIAIINSLKKILDREQSIDEVDHPYNHNHDNNQHQKQQYQQQNNNLETCGKFLDGKRSVDFILAYNGKESEQDVTKKFCIKSFIENLEKNGLEIELNEVQGIHFVKIHAPTKVLQQYCEILKVKLPIKEIEEQENISEPEFELMANCKNFFEKPLEFVKLDPKLFPKKEYRIKLEYSYNYDYLFDCKNEDLFNSYRSMIINFILEGTSYYDKRNSNKEDNEDEKGIEELIRNGVIIAAYPLHDGGINTIGSQRNLLLNEWASIRNFLKYQPLDNIKDYFGAKVAMYFAWLGFYTHMLIPASIVGLICFFYGVFSLSSDRLSEDICIDKNTILMCPLCDAKCDYWYLQKTCTYSKINYLFDNKLTVFFAFFMSFWAVLYLELWKRYSASLVHKWGLIDYTPHVEYPRRKYLDRVKNMKHQKFNVEHKVLEPHVPFWKYKFPVHFATFTTVILFITLALATIFGLVVYRMSTMTTRNIYGTVDSTSYKIMAQPITAAIIDLIVITILDYCYNILAEFLTDFEFRRTQADYNESLTLKIYMFQFINYYSCLFYIAFLKGKFVGYPAKYNRIFGFRQEECNPGGCLMELCIQLIIIMIGKQAINALLEMLTPYLMKTLNSIKQRLNIKNNVQNQNENIISCNQWTEDYKLLPWTSRDLFYEYLEMVLQFGFITIFVVAFPLAPLFALCNNVLEMRLDAKKFLKYYRRPVPQRVKDIGVWYNILAIVSRIAVASSAFIIAFSTNLIPKLVYMSVVSENNTDEGFLNHTLAYFDIKDFQEGTRPVQTSFQNVTICRYSEYRNPPWSSEKYKRPLIYWHILAARLAFFVVFQNVVGIIQSFVAWMIPDLPGKLRNKIKREEYLTRETIIKEETKRRLRDQNKKKNEITAEIENSTNLNKQIKFNKNRGDIIEDIDVIENVIESDTEHDILRRRLNGNEKYNPNRRTII